MIAIGPHLVPAPDAPELTRQRVALFSLHDVAHNLDAYLQSSEAKIAGIRPGLGKGILWQSPTHAKTPLAFVFMHGFSASRGELSPVLEDLSAQLKANVYFSRLKAHGLTNGEAFGGVTVQDWYDDAREAMAIGREIGDCVVLVGISTGATLAIQTAMENRERPELGGVVLLSPNFMPSDWRARYFAGPLGRFWARLMIGRQRDYANPEAERPAISEATRRLRQGIWTHPYRSEGIVAMMDLVNYVDALDLRQFKLPLLMLYTHNDRVVDVPMIQEKFAEIGSVEKRLVDVPGAVVHGLAGDVMGPQVTPTVEAEIKKAAGIFCPAASL